MNLDRVVGVLLGLQVVALVLGVLLIVQMVAVIRASEQWRLLRLGLRKSSTGGGVGDATLTAGAQLVRSALKVERARDLSEWENALQEVSKLAELLREKRTRPGR